MTEKVDVVQLDRILQSGLLDQAEALLRAKLDTDDEGSLERLGNLYRQQGKLAQAADIFMLWAQKFPQSNKARYFDDLFHGRPLSVAWTAGRYAPTPFYIRDDFLPTALHEECIRFVVESCDRFKPSELLVEQEGKWESTRYPELHNSSHIGLGSALKGRFLAEVAKCLPSIGLQDRVKACESTAPFLLHHGDGNYFAGHTDRYDTEGPGMTLIYLFSSSEKGFTGGANVFYDTDVANNDGDCNNFTLLHFADNRLIAFPGKHFHGVLPVRCVDKRFESARFSLVTFLDA